MKARKLFGFAAVLSIELFMLSRNENNANRARVNRAARRA